MPTLKDLKCSIELADNHHTLQEFGTTYSDGCVETFVAVPRKPGSFSIHLTSDRFIAPGISMYVFVDGVYQCNRNRQDLKLRKGSDSRSVVDFTVRQKEEKQKDGSMIAREWKFDKLDTSKWPSLTKAERLLIAVASADTSSNTCSPNVLENLGCIEVLVLRCAGARNAKTTSVTNLDGTNDFQPPSFALDGQPRPPDLSIYDDHGPYFGDHKYVPPQSGSEYHSPYVETVHSHDTKPRTLYSVPPFAPRSEKRAYSKVSGKFSPGASLTTSLPSNAFQYGSGPIPRGPMFGSERSFYHTHPASAVVANAPDADPAWLSEMMTKAAKRVVEEYRRAGIDSKSEKHSAVDPETATQSPGAWPQSPYAQPVQPPSAHQFEAKEDTSSVRGQHMGGWSAGNADEKAKAQVRWDTESEWESHSVSGGWRAAEETASDTWDTDETWDPKPSARSHNSQRGHPEAASMRSKSDRKSMASDTRRTHWSHHPEKDRSRRSRSHSRSTKPESGDEFRDQEGWLPVETGYDQDTSSEASDATIRGHSHGHRPKKSSKSHKRSHYATSADKSEKRSSRHLRGGEGITESSMRRRAASMASGARPEVMNAPLRTPASAYLPQELPRTIGVPEQHATAWVPPAPFNTYEGKSAWGPGNTGGWGDANTAVKNEYKWAIPQDDQDSWEVIEHPKDNEARKKDSHGWDEGHNKTHKTKKTANRWQTHDDAWAIHDNVPKPTAPNPNPEINSWSPGLTEPKPTNPPKRHTNKSLSKYRRTPRPPFPSPSPKPHWQFPPLPTSPLQHSASPILPAAPPLIVPSATGLSHRVLTGPGSSYGHMIGRPAYLDSLEKPYALFRFKYRSRGLLKSMFGEVVAEEMKRAVEERERGGLRGLGREELVERVVRMRIEGEGRKGRERKGSRSTESVARGLTERWVEGQSWGKGE